MTVVTIEEAKERIEELSSLAASGEQVRITRGDLPPVALTSLAGSPAPEGKRVAGLWEGQFVVGPEFFEPLPDEWLDLFYNGPVFPEDSNGATANLSVSNAENGNRKP